MIKAGRDKWTDNQILDALHGRNGSQCVSFRFDVLRDGVRQRSITAQGSVSLNRFADIQRTARFTLYEELDWLKDEIKPFMRLRMEDTTADGVVIALIWDDRDALGLTFDALDALAMTWDEIDAGRFDGTVRAEQYAEFPLGVFILSTPTRTSRDALNTWTVEAYDRTVILVEDSLTEPLLVSAGTTYFDAVQSILVSAGISRVIIADLVDTEIPADRVFEIGTKKLTVINTLLTEINFNPIYCDVDGVFVLSAYVEPSASSVDYTYKADELSIIGRDTKSDLDYFDVPNVFIAVCSNPDLDQDYTSVWTNDNAASRLSTIQRGRKIVSEIKKPDCIASQNDLNAYIRRVAFEAHQVYEKLEFVTALNPLHGRAENLQIQHPDATGVFVESSWTLPLSASGQMSHAARRLIVV